MIVAGIWRLAAGDLDPIVYSSEQARLLTREGAVGTVTVFLVLRAFASGTTALTGVEAISNGVSAFRAPEAVNAKKTLMVMATIMGALFLGITYLAVQLEARPYDSGYPTVISQIARQVLGNGPAFIIVQAATLLILVLAANTAFSGFPLLPASPPATPCCPASCASAATGWSTPTASSPCRRWPSSSSWPSRPTPTP